MFLSLMLVPPLHAMTCLLNLIMALLLRFFMVITLVLTLLPLLLLE